MKGLSHNYPLWSPDKGGGSAAGDNTFEVDFEDNNNNNDQPNSAGKLDEFVKMLQENPIARRIAEAALKSSEPEAGGAPQGSQPPDPISVLRQRLEEVNKQLEENPQDAHAFAEKIKLEAQIGSLEQAQQLMKPLAVQQQVQQVLTNEVPRVLSELSSAYPEFENFRAQVQAELQQALFSRPDIAADPQQLKAAAELIADRYFSQYVREKQKKGTALSGNFAHVGAAAPTPRVEGLTDEEAALFQQAKQFYGDLTPEEWKTYFKDPTADVETEYTLRVKNIAGATKGGDK